MNAIDVIAIMLITLMIMVTASIIIVSKAIVSNMKDIIKLEKKNFELELKIMLLLRHTAHLEDLSGIKDFEKELEEIDEKGKNLNNMFKKDK